MSSIEKRNAIITGAGGGMGREIARQLAECDIQVALVGRRRAPLEETKAIIEQSGGEALVVVADLAKGEDLDRIVDEVHEHFGPVDVLVNNAGSASRVLNLEYISDEEWTKVVEVNLGAVAHLVQRVLPDMLPRHTGTIVTVSSLAARNPNLLGGVAYGAAKAGVNNLMQFLHNTYRQEGLRAITVMPGETNTSILDARANPPSQVSRERMVQPEDIGAVVALAVSLPQRTVLSEIVVAPTVQRDIAGDLAISRAIGEPDAS
ncbi:MAG: SDR family oxidoreductase [Bifidobacterium tibiigranuli]|jgi:NADP-dependent 3-hydroxy acid dehydrogenase YdfG|uniref:SDR family oxidoreductase n=1 Tax=Bifidobacterium tibiigranuli TaxID=2172043 RepID=UPI0026F2728C|nr:SDR family oxidoreductase [Bifidobacterium tibiigranuli]MCI1673675.1 SDR family oxidoreductase [Bifidobacterium tibiigranuli]MCI1712931.1 SDR family oxidoreductase [Bifidobacterium tibiigranuli]MCI1833562.1 SDR family oxidoreductase [Bifidobacterium tibiigranuli]